MSQKTEGPQIERPYILLGADAWVSAETITQAYRAAQRHALGKRKRAISAVSRSLALVRFMARYLHDRPPWPTLVSQWNYEYPQWSYDDTSNPPRRFASDVARAKRELGLL